MSDNLYKFRLIQYMNHKNDNNMCPTYREVRSNLSDLSDKFNMELDTNPTKLAKCVRLIEKSNLSVV